MSYRMPGQTTRATTILAPTTPAKTMTAWTTSGPIPTTPYRGHREIHDS